MRRYLWLGLVCLCVSFGTFFASLDADFLFLDDSLHVYDNPGVSEPTLSSVISFWKKPYMGLYIPVTYSVWAAQSALARKWGNWTASGNPDARYFHRTNIVLHAINALLFFVLCEVLGLTFLQSCFAMLLFLVHPLHVEAVAWVSGLKDLLSALFALGALILFFSREHSGAGAKLRYLLSTILFLCSVLSKPSMVVLPAIAGILAVGLRSMSWKKAGLAVLPWIIATIPIVVMTSGLQGDHSENPVSFWNRVFSAGSVWAFYLGKLIVPTNLVPDYSFLPTDFSMLMHIIGWLAVALVCLWAYRSGKWASVCVSWFLVSLAPVSGLIPFDFGSFSYVADRYAYFSVGAIAILAARCLEQAAVVRQAGAVALLLIFSFSSASYAAKWKDTPTLFTYTIEKNPRSRLAYYNLGIYYAWVQKPTIAESFFKEGIERGMRWPDLHFHYAFLLARYKRYEEASQQYGQGMKNLGKRTAALHCQYAGILSQAGHRKAADVELKSAKQLEPETPCQLPSQH